MAMTVKRGVFPPPYRLISIKGTENSYDTVLETPGTREMLLDYC